MSEYVKIVKDGKEIEVEFKNVLTGKDQKRYLKTLASFEKSPEIIGDFLDLQDELIEKSTGLTKEELENLPLAERQKLTNKLFEIVSESLGFTKTFAHPQNSSPKDTEKS